MHTLYSADCVAVTGQHSIILLCLLFFLTKLTRDRYWQALVNDGKLSRDVKKERGVLLLPLVSDKK